MPVVAMKVAEKSAHEKTDKLFIYRFESPEQGEIVIVANLTNVYEAGDVVAVALVGSRLPDGLIQKRQVFGIESSGMALGKVDAELDQDLTEQFEADRELSSWKITYEVKVEGYYAEDAQKEALKVLKKGKGAVVAVEQVD